MTKRQPTPTGWSDTDWIKKLQDEEENPLGCLHINQGSFDAAADAYEEEYKMSKRTAMDIALDLDAASCSSFAKLEAAEALRQKHDEIERMRKELESARLYLGDSKLESDQLRDEAYSARKQRDSEKQKAKMLQAEIDRLKRERHHIYDLLARIHRDGGQYTSDHGVEKACEDAESQVVAWLETINGIDALIEQARIAERAACAATAPDLLWALETIIDASPEPPEANCSCHICPPCRDCVDYEELREAYRYVRAAIAKAA